MCEVERCLLGGRCPPRRDSGLGIGVHEAAWHAAISSVGFDDRRFVAPGPRRAD
jgi:hypothetical protein